MRVKEKVISPYSHEFYKNRHQNTVHSASTILGILANHIPPIQSAVDIGCGVGTWLSVLHEQGIEEIQGVDGSWVDESLLAIPKNRFKQIDLSTALVRLERKFDLAISLEVAEHLPAERADDFVSSLTALSDQILFSAAIPFQGGANHVNEQWQSYWVKKFDSLNYEVHDFIRPKIWSDIRIPYWYRQNTLFFSRRGTTHTRSSKEGSTTPQVIPIDLVHPELYAQKNVQLDLRGSFRVFHRSLKSYLRNKANRNG